MARSFNTTSRRVEKAEEAGLLALLRRLFRRPHAGGISHLNDRMLRDIGLGDGGRSEYRKIERLRRP
jgi:hypothetical protein